MIEAVDGPELRWRDDGGLRRLEARFAGGARAAFTTRIGGASEAPFDSLNLGILTGDERDRVVANRIRLTEALGVDPGRVVLGRQVHGADLLEHSVPQAEMHFARPRVPPPEVDGHFTDRADLALLVLVADCLPIALEGERGVAMLHGGWRGLAAGIVERGVEAVGAREAVIGPGIGPCCFEVGDEVVAEFDHLGIDLVEGRCLDLPEAARRLLRRAGVERVSASALCTACNPDLLFSHRRGGPTTGRAAGLIWKPSR